VRTHLFPPSPERAGTDKFICLARFRAKKKQQVLNLERNISEMTSRVDELEREAGDLRRENGWLKEIVMLRGKTLTGQAGLMLSSPAPGSSGNNQGSGPDESGLSVKRSEG
jgi:hypothetical protein